MPGVVGEQWSTRGHPPGCQTLKRNLDGLIRDLR